MLINCKQLFRDSFHIFKGLYAILSYCISKDKIKVGLSHFSTSSQVVIPGHNCTYAVGISNISKQGVWVKLFFDMYLKENPVDPEGHYGYFEKAIFVRAHETQSLQIIYDWKDYAVIDIDDVNFEPDVFWSGKCQTKGKYFVKALLLNEKGEAFEELTLVQILSE